MLKNVEEFKCKCREYLSTLSLDTLRVIGRKVNVHAPTQNKNKPVLIELILGVLAGEILPAPRSNRGKPVIDDYIKPEILNDLKDIYESHVVAPEKEIEEVDIITRLKEVKENPHILKVESPNAHDFENRTLPEVYRGQLETLQGVSRLLPLDCIDNGEKIIVSIETIRAYGLREGDVVSCHVKKSNNAFVVTEILTINELVVDSFKRVDFDTTEVYFPEKRINFYGEGQDFVGAKYLQWLLPVGKGQRGLIVAPPKAGKSSLLAELAQEASKLNNGMRVFTLFVDQSPENIGRYRKATGGETFVYTSYEDEPDRQVFVADFILKRAKRYAECGLDVLLVVESFDALAPAFNDTDASLGGKTLPGGLESKTVHYLKRYFGAARSLENSGSLTILGTLSIDTGNPMDEILKSELSTIGNLQISLSDELAKRRVYPAIDVAHTQSNQNNFHEKDEVDLDIFLRNEFLPKFGTEKLLSLLKESSTLEELKKNL